MSLNENLLTQFEELKVLVEILQTDVVKNAQGNKSAGVQADFVMSLVNGLGLKDAAKSRLKMNFRNEYKIMLGLWFFHVFASVNVTLRLV